MTTVTRRGVCAVATSAVALLVSELVLAPDQAAATQRSRLRFELRRDPNAEYRWRLKGGNGELIASGEGYKAKAACRHAIDVIKRGAGSAAITDLTAP